MARRDPKNERGPRIGHIQRKTRSPCPNCPPELAEALAKAAAIKAAKKANQPRLDGDIMSATGQGTALWKHVAIGTGTCITMIDRYVDAGLPGDPLPLLVGFRDHLQKIINKLEATDASNTPKE